jgi:hypothetical protein
VRLYICYGTFPAPWRPGGHPCRNAYKALKEAGYEPELVRSYGLGPLPSALNQTPGRKAVKELTGKYWVPVLVTDDGETIADSKNIAAWAEANPAAKAPAASGA